MRQLAAILFADMAGYTALMQDNEQLARQKRKHMKEVLDSSVRVSAERSFNTMATVHLLFLTVLLTALTVL